MPDKTKASILCVDDEKDIVDSLYDTLMENYDVKTACSGDEALKIFDEEDIAVVITDQRMPGMEGTELLARINEKKPFCKKILLTGYSDINAAVDAINKGSVDKYFSKPWEDEELIKTVENLASMYDFDKYLHKMQQDGEGMKKKISAGEAFKNFINGYQMGVCVLGPDNTIEFLNKKALEMLQYNDPGNIRGKDFNSVFLLDSNKKDIAPLVVFDGSRFVVADNSCMDLIKLRVMLSDGTKAVIEGNLIFDIDTKQGDVKFCGMIFNESS